MSLNLDCDAAEISRMHDAVSTFAAPFDPPRKPLQQFILALEEIVANSMRHGQSGDAPLDLRVSITLDERMLSSEIIDAGVAFDPFTEAAEPDLSSSIAEREIGGLGIHLVKTLVDSYSYRHEDGRNHITLTKRLG